MSIASKKSNKRHSKLSNNRHSRTASSGNERQREKNSNGRLSIPFVQEEEKPLAIVKESSADVKL